MRRSAQRHHNTRHLGLRASSSPDDEDAVSVSDLVEMEVGGVSISPAGFVALLVPAGKASALAPAPNPVEALRSPSQPLPAEIADLPILPVLITEGVDVDGAVSEYAQAMLQLLQDPPCDMGIQLPYDALDKITGTSGAVLGAVLIGRASFAATEPKSEPDTEPDATAPRAWEATLLAGKELEQSARDVLGGASEAWKCLALARRYESYGCRIFATRDALRSADLTVFMPGAAASAADGLTVGTARAAFPRMQTVAEARAVAAEAREKYLWKPFLDAAEAESMGRGSGDRDGNGDGDGDGDGDER